MKNPLRIMQTAVLLFFTIMVPAQRPGFNDNLPGLIKWTDDNHALMRLPDENGKVTVFDYDCRTGRKAVVVDFKSDQQKLREMLPAGIGPGPDMVVASDSKAVVISKDNDLWYYTEAIKNGRRLTDDEATEVNVRFAPDDRKIAYTKNRDLYVFDLYANRETRLTSDAGERIYNGWASWVYYEEILGRSSKYAAFWWSPDSRRIAFLHSDDSPVPVYYLNSLENTDGTHGRLETTYYPKAGDPNPRVKMGIADVETARTTWVKTDENIDQYIAWPSWTPDGRRLMIQVLNRDQDDMRFILADAATGDYTEIYRETRPTWVDFFEDVYVMKDGSGFILRSCRSDWYNLYYYGWDGKLISQITSAGWKVSSIVSVDEAKREIYFEGTGPDPLENHLYRVRLDGTRLLEITTGEGYHSASVSPGGSWFIDNWSNIINPGGINLIDRNAKVSRIMHQDEVIIFDPAKHQRSEIVSITTSDGLFNMPAIITYPVNFDSTRKYPVVFTVYGGPDGGSITKKWPGYQPKWYARNGIIIIDVDHRGSGAFGKKGLDYMYRSLGKWEISDYSDAVKWLRKKPWVDENRMGITGGSYGGYTTCMALTRGAAYWTHGIADYSVTDWRLYDNIYTERFMDTPQDNPEGYKDGSVLTWAKNFKGKLLLRHGDMDNNVHMQNSIWLITTLQDLDKPFEFMLYPGERHGVGGPKRLFMTDEGNEFWLRHFFGKQD